MRAGPKQANHIRNNAMKCNSFDWVNKMSHRGVEKTTVCLKEKPEAQNAQQNAILSIVQMKQTMEG